MVVCYHVWFGRVSGGVDVFLLISAFLLTLSFVRKAERGQPLQLLKYWVHLFKRLLPAVAIVLVGTLAAAALFVPALRWEEILTQTWASLFYVENWVLAANSVDYYASDHSTASPLQHFWSLSVQGQVFILWPLLFAAGGLVAKAARLRYRRLMMLIFGLVFLVSLAFSIVETSTNQGYAYFDTRARLWEFALGSLLALALPRLRFGSGTRAVMAWIGLAAMLTGGFLLDVQGQFPGFVALWPTLAAALVIIAGRTGKPWAVDRFLSWRPLVRMGDISYALYLWHWPVLVIYLIFTDQQNAGPLDGLLVIAVSVVLAGRTTVVVERPIRQSLWFEKRRRRAMVAIAACLTLVAVPTAAWQLGLHWQQERVMADADRNNPGAAAMLMPHDAWRGGVDGRIIPAVATIHSDWVRLDGPCKDGLEPGSRSLKAACQQNYVDGPADRTVVIVGDSHAQQWAAAMGSVARERTWELATVLKGGCKFAAPGFGQDEACDRFNEDVIDYLLEKKPDAVFSVATAATASSAQDHVTPGYIDAAAALTEAGIEVVGVRDNPRFGFDMLACVVERGQDAPACAPPREQSLNATPPFDEIRQGVPGIHLLDLTDLLCSPAACPGVAGNRYIYMDGHHLTKTYVESMTPEFERRLLETTGWS
jgi:peptidoglycan/LPS O-acetylase OafA/YrhL